MTGAADQTSDNLILVIDDDPQFGKFLQKGLSAKGYEAVFTESGKEGLEFLQENRPSYILTDIVMPDKEGIELILEIRKSGYSNPIIAMSGHSAQSSSYLEAAKLLGADASLGKPFSIEDFESLAQNLNQSIE